jgi:ABC-2 type transport system permease protein
VEVHNTVPTAARPRPSAIQQWWVLVVRAIVPTLRNGELITAVAASVIVTAGFYIPLNKVMGAGTDGTSYAQFLAPLIVLQAMSFAAIMGAFRAAIDAAQGVNRRFGAMPIATVTPMAARLSATMYRCVVGLVVALICGYVIGFRFHRGAVCTVGFCLLVLLVGVMLSLLGDLIGTGLKNPEATIPLLTGPQLILGLFSVGIQPADQFPEWIQPVVRDQPISQFVYALRALAGDTGEAAPAVSWPVLGPALAWVLGLLVFLALVSVAVLRRRP